MDIKELTLKKQDLIIKLNELRIYSTSFGFTGNRKYYARGTIEKEKWDAYKLNSIKILRLEKEIARVSKDIKSQNKYFSDKEDELRKILFECLPRETVYAIFDEMQRRLKGEKAFKVSIDNKKFDEDKSNFNKLKKTLSDAVDDLKKVRSSITKYIYENEPEVNKADFLLQVSPINKSCPTISKINEYEKILNS